MYTEYLLITMVGSLLLVALGLMAAAFIKGRKGFTHPLKDEEGE